jgi:hypothetical protein
MFDRRAEVRGQILDSIQTGEITLPLVELAAG